MMKLDAKKINKNLFEGYKWPTRGPESDRNNTPYGCLSLVDQIAQILSEKILTGEIKGGSRLNEEQLKVEFGISRTPLREAFRILDKKGLVEVLPRKGVFVKSISKKDIQENFPVRANLEGLAAVLAYPHLKEQDVKHMEDALEAMKQASQKRDFYEYTLNHKDFHEIFISACKNDVLITALYNLRMHTLWHRYTFQYYQQDFKESIRLHRKILNLFASANTSLQELEHVVRYHIEIAMEPFLSAMDKLESTTDEPQTLFT
ncbi:MAG: GntR family transcriptional regulator [Desulfohalobiaceae bacterium]|nr:GntR family transcriptional regulator [Desulfohalobiaceae bacterium]